MLYKMLPYLLYLYTNYLTSLVNSSVTTMGPRSLKPGGGGGQPGCRGEKKQNVRKPLHIYDHTYIIAFALRKIKV